MVLRNCTVSKILSLQDGCSESEKRFVEDFLIELDSEVYLYVQHYYFFLLTISKWPYGNMQMRCLNSTRACWSSGVPLQGLSWGMMMHIWKIYAPCLRGQGWSRQRGGPHRICHRMTLRMSVNQMQTTLLWWIPLLVCFKCMCLCVLTILFQFSPLNMVLKRKMSLMKNSLTGEDH